MDIKKLKAFSMVAEFGSFSRAAGMLGMAQPVLSRQVRSLEEDLGVQLVHRNGRGIIVLPSQAASGRSRIVARLSGPATLPASVADFVVTEHGIAALRDRSAEERRAALIAVADPAHRRELAA